MPALIIIGCIILFFVFLFSVHILINIQMADEMALTIRVLGIPIRILPKKPKQYKLKNYTLKKIRKRDEAAAKKKKKKAENAAKKKKKKQEAKEKKAAEEALLTKEELAAKKAAKKAGQPKITDMIVLIARVAGLFFSRFFGKFHIKVARLHVTTGAKDAMSIAVTTAVVDKSIKYLLWFLGKIAHVDGLKKADILVQPDYHASAIKFDCDLTIRVTLGGMLGAVFKAGFAFLFGYIKIKPDPKHPEPSIFPDLPPLPPLPELPEGS